MTAPELKFSVAEVVPDSVAAAPTLQLRLRIERAGGGQVRSMLLTTAVNIAPARRGYDETTQRRLAPLFGAPQRWDTTLRGLNWQRPTVVVPAFGDDTIVSLGLPCSTDFELATSKYLHAVREGDIVLELQFSGTVFYQAENGQLRTAQLDWNLETETTFPVSSWHDLIERYYGDSRWIRIGTSTFDQLEAYRARHVLSSWDQAVAGLLRDNEAEREEAPTWTG